MRKVAWFTVLAALFGLALLIEKCTTMPGDLEGPPAAHPITSGAEAAAPPVISDDLILTLGGDRPRSDARRLSPGGKALSSRDSNALTRHDPGRKPSRVTTPHPQRHKLAAGETIESLCRRIFGSELYALHLREINRIPLDSPVPAGTILVLPPRGRLERRYRVAKNDTLSQIAQRLLGTIRRTHELARLNGLANANDIHENQILKLPPP